MVGRSCNQYSKWSHGRQLILKICVVTTSRSDYGLLKWILKKIKNDSFFKLQLIVTGTHLSKTYGYTKSEILDDGFAIDFEIDMIVDGDTKQSITTSMGICQMQMGTALSQLQPDLLLVLGDRFELLPICSSALVLGVPIAHISGGDVTEGAIDDQVRHAVTKMATIHFPGVKSSADRIIQMGESPQSVFDVGEPGIEGFLKAEVPTREEIAHTLGLSINKCWIICTYHPETNSDLKTDLSAVKAIVSILSKYNDYEILFTASNADCGGDQINTYFTNSASKYDNIHFVHSLGQKRFIGFMKEAVLMIGNSSSGLTEAPSCSLPVINIGDRQKGRIIPENVIQSGKSEADINKAIIKALSDSFRNSCVNIVNPYGDGNTSSKVVDILKSIDLSHYIELKKGFYSLNV